MFTLPAWLKALGDLVAPLLSAALSSVLGALRTKRLDTERDQLNRSDARNEAARETEDVIAEIADDEKQIVVGGSANDIARRLRVRKSGASPDGAEPR